jgi:putative hydroxymethylpyrimidine transport system ATP-binding protein
LLQDKGVKEMIVNLPRPRSTELTYQSEFITMRKELEWLIHNEC